MAECLNCPIVMTSVFNVFFTSEHRVSNWLRYLTADRLVRVRELPRAYKYMVDLLFVQFILFQPVFVQSILSNPNLT